jgi:hypothetical protein
MNESQQMHFLKIILVFIALMFLSLLPIDGTMAFRLDLAAETTGV